MANEPNNAEEQVKQYAADRRQLVPQEIHPATRNLLQGEVTRTYGSPQQERRARLRLRWLQAFATLAVLAIIPFFLMPRSPDSRKAQEATPSKAEEVTLPTQSKPGEAPIQISDTPTPVAPIVTESAKASAAAPPAPAPLREEARTDSSGSRALTSRSRSVEAVPATENLRATATLADVAAPNNVQRVSLVNNLSAPQALKNFQFEQVGERVRVLDSDGSVYPGRSLTSNTFHVAGMNKTLKQAVTFTGQVFRASLQQSQSQQQISNAAANNSEQNRAYINNAAANNNLNNSVSNYSDEVRVQGQAIIGNNNYRIDAQQAPGK